MSSPLGNTLRSAPRRPQRRPLWLTILLLVVAMAVLFGLGFGIATLIRGTSTVPEATSSETAEGATTPLPCETTLVTPAAELPSPERVTVNVFNSTNKVGLAAETARALSERGFKINKVSNDPTGTTIRGIGEIRHGPNGEKQAELLTFYFPGATLIDDGRKGKRVDISIGRGYKEMPGVGQVAAALAEPTPEYSGPGCPTTPAATTDPTQQTTPSPSPSPSE